MSRFQEIVLKERKLAQPSFSPLLRKIEGRTKLATGLQRQESYGNNVELSSFWWPNDWHVRGGMVQLESSWPRILVSTILIISYINFKNSHIFSGLQFFHVSDVDCGNSNFFYCLCYHSFSWLFSLSSPIPSPILSPPYVNPHIVVCVHSSWVIHKCPLVNPFTIFHLIITLPSSSCQSAIFFKSYFEKMKRN